MRDSSSSGQTSCEKAQGRLNRSLWLQVIAEVVDGSRHQTMSGSPKNGHHEMANQRHPGRSGFGGNRTVVFSKDDIFDPRE